MNVEIGGVGSESRVRAVKKYFRRTPDSADDLRAVRLFPVAAAAALGAAALFIMASFPAALLLGLVAVALCCKGVADRASYRRRFAAAEPKPSDAQMDEVLRGDIGRAAERALCRLGLTRDELELRSDDVDPLADEPRGGRLADLGRGPIAVFGPTAETGGRIGLDRKWRFANYDIMILCPTGHHLGIYQCSLNLATGRRRDEETREYHYMDVVAISTTTRESDLSIRVLDPAAQHVVPIGRPLSRELEIIVSSGDRSSIVVGLKDDEKPQDTVHLQESGIDYLVETVRRMLREKKGGVAPFI